MTTRTKYARELTCGDSRSALLCGVAIGMVLLAVMVASAPVPLRAQTTDNVGEWHTWGSNLANMRYAPLDQITADNFDSLELA